MERTTIMLPAELRAKAKFCARERGITLAELVRLTLAAEVGKARKRDPIFEDLPSGPRRRGVPTDLSENHDAHLYGPKRPKKARSRR